jgi:serine/threonine protein kinase
MVTPLVGTPSAAVGTVLSRRWRLVRKLGEGGMGEVFAAESIDGGTKAAVKILRREFVGDPEVRFRFLEEARTCMRLVHPNIVRVLDCARAEDDAPYIVMELLDGVPLGAYMQNGARIPLAQAVPILQAILAGLGAAHAAGVVHRDLKPDNVILTRDPRGAFVVKLVDFGIAKVMDAAGGMGNRTRTGVLLGTPAYMSPEQARSARDVDQRADLWSVGVLFYEMLTGRVAFAAPTEYARLAALLSAEPEPIDRIDPSLSPLAAFLDRALRKNRDERFASAAEMARALSVALPTAPTTATRSDPPPARLPSNPPDPGSATTAVPAGRGRPREAGKEAPREVPTASGINRRTPGEFGLVPSAAEISGASSPIGPSTAGAAPKAGSHHGTLASAHAQVGAGGGAGAVTVDPAPQVLFVDPRPLGGTLPSETRSDDRLSRPPKRGIARGIVVLLVVLALAVGAMLGWVASRI